MDQHTTPPNIAYPSRPYNIMATYRNMVHHDRAVHTIAQHHITYRPITLPIKQAIRALHITGHTKAGHATSSHYVTYHITTQFSMSPHDGTDQNIQYIPCHAIT
eukprot:2551645-Pyramimonas_sp.AAC.1